MQDGKLFFYRISFSLMIVLTIVYILFVSLGLYCFGCIATVAGLLSFELNFVSFIVIIENLSIFVFCEHKKNTPQNHDRLYYYI